MAEYISFQPSDFFNTKLYTGTGAELAITGVGFQPDLIWNKERSGTEGQNWTDAARGVTKYVMSNNTDGESTNVQSVKSFDSDGFTLGTFDGMNTNTETYVSWNWKAGTTSGLSGGTITPSAYSFNTTSGISILAYTGTGSTGTIAHGLGAVPGCIIVKNLGATAEWQSYQQGIDATAPEDYTLQLSANGARFDTDTRWNDTAPTSSVFTVAGNDTVNGDTVAYIAYVFAEKKGYSKFGGYTGNGDNDGAFIYTGFRPAFVIVKESVGGNAGGWITYDNKKPTTYNVNQDYLQANDSAAQVNASTYALDFLSNGFKIRASNGVINGSGNEYIYIAFAEFPLVSSNDVPTVAR